MTTAEHRANIVIRGRGDEIWTGEPSQRCKFQEFLSSFPGVSPKGEVSPIQQRVILPRARFAQILNWPGEGHGTCLTEDKEKYSSTVKGSFFFQSPALTIELKGRKTV